MNKNKILLGGLVAAIGISLVPIYLIPKKRPDFYRKFMLLHRVFRKTCAKQEASLIANLLSYFL